MPESLRQYFPKIESPPPGLCAMMRGSDLPWCSVVHPNQSSDLESAETLCVKLLKYQLVSCSWGSDRAVGLKTDSVSVPLADLLVGHSTGRASSFGCQRIGSVHGLCRRPFGVSHPPGYIAASHLRCGIHVSARTSCFRQAAPDCIRALRSSPSRSLGSAETDNPSWIHSAT